MWNMRAFRRLRSFDLPDNSSAGSVSFSPDGHTLAAGASDGTLRIYDVHSSRGAPVAAWSLQSQNARAASVQYSATGSAVVSLTQAGLLQQWDLRRLSSKKLGQPQWSVDLSSFCTPSLATQMLAIACSARAVAISGATSAVPIVQYDALIQEPCKHLLEVPASGQRAVESVVSAVGWHSNASVICCGLDQGDVYIQHLKLR